jgi:hypothetical protein
MKQKLDQKLANLHTKLANIVLEEMDKQIDKISYYIIIDEVFFDIFLVIIYLLVVYIIIGQFLLIKLEKNK